MLRSAKRRRRDPSVNRMSRATPSRAELMAPTRLSPSGGRHLRPTARVELSSAPSVGRPAARFAACGRTRAAPSMKWFASPAVRRFPNRESCRTIAGDAVTAGTSVRRDRRGDGESVGSSIEERNLRTAPNVREAGGLVQPRREFPRVLEPADRRVSPTPRLGTEPPAPRSALDRRAQPSTRWNSGWRHDRRYDWRDWRRRHRSRFHFGILLRPLRLGLFPLRDRLAPVAELLSQQLLAARSLGISVAAGLRAVSLDPLSP